MLDGAAGADLRHARMWIQTTIDRSARADSHRTTGRRESNTLCFTAPVSPGIRSVEIGAAAGLASCNVRLGSYPEHGNGIETGAPVVVEVAGIEPASDMRCGDFIQS